MTTDTTPIAKSTIQKLLERKGRQQLSIEALPIEERFPNLHGESWGPPKVGKTDLPLRARTHEVRTKGKTDPKTFEVLEKGEVVIPSKPLTIAFANFDRDPRSVLLNLPEDVEIAHEPFYLDEDGEPIPYLSDAEIEKLLKRLVKFIEDVEAVGGVDLFLLDGATIVWSNIRTIRLGPPAGTTPEGEPRHLPRQYDASNSEMRSTVMQRIYAMDCHTWVTREAREKWGGQNSVVYDAQGNAVLQADGWNKTGHYVDISGQMKIAEVSAGGGQTKKERRYIVGDDCVNAAAIGRTIQEPTFAKLYATAYPSVPLLKREDRALFGELQDKRGHLEWS